MKRRGHPWGSHHSASGTDGGHQRRHCGPPWGGHSRRRARWGLRRRLQASFAFVALAAVGLTTFLTVGTVLDVRGQILRDVVTTPPTSATGDDGPTVNIGPDDAVREAFRRVTRTAFVAALLSFALASIAAGLMTRRLTRPLVALVDGAQRLAAGEREVRLQLPSPRDELRVLTESFNRLGEGLERQESWRRDMVADIAHDLRTPLAVLRSEIEAMQDGVRRPDEAGLARLHGEVSMLTRLVDDLRTLSQVERGAVSLVPTPTDLSALLERARDAFVVPAQAAGVTLRLEPVPAGLTVSVDPERIQQVLGNLIDNALRYAPRSEVTLWAELAPPDGVALVVADRGPGLAPSDPEQLFERFYRGDRARGRTAAHPGATTSQASGNGAGRGSGLGLAIARALAEAHGGHLTAHERQGGGAEFRLWLPHAVLEADPRDPAEGDTHA